MPDRRPVTLFALATLVPVPVLLAGAALGGGWIWAALVYLTVFALLLDQIVAIVTPNAPEGAEFPAADSLSGLLALAHFPLLAAGIWAVSGASGLTGWERLAAFFAFGFFSGQVSNSNAHELIHRPGRGLRALGVAVYVSQLFGHHASAHPKVHHVHVGTPNDPNSAPRGMSFYRFAPRAWAGSFREGLRAEIAMNARRAHPLPLWRLPYTVYVGGALAALLASTLAFGGAGLLAHLALASFATTQLLQSDYVQHYGLRRVRRDDGTFAPVTLAHSWNTPHWFTSYLMLNAPRHSDHHAHPARKYPGLQLPEADAAPMLPLSLPLMAGIALMPRLWRRMMDPRLPG